MATLKDFQKIDIRVGKIIKAKDFPEVRILCYKIEIDLGPEIGVKKSCAQLVKNYKIKDLVNKKVLCVVNFPAKQIGPAISEVLILGVPDKDNEPILVVPEKDVLIGGCLY